MSHYLLREITFSQAGDDAIMHVTYHDTRTDWLLITADVTVVGEAVDIITALDHYIRRKALAALDPIHSVED